MQTILPNTVLSRFFTGNRNRPPIRRRDLSRRKLLTEIFPDGGKINCIRGTLWITQKGKSQDILLRAGERLCCETNSSFVIEALEISEVELIG